MSYLYILIFITLLSGLYFCVKYSHPKSMEGLTNNNNTACPNILIQKDSKFYLYNSKVAKVPGVNPIEFENLEDYTEFIDWQRSQGLRCPILYLQHTYDAQGEGVYKIRPDVNEPQGGLPPSGSTSAPNPTLLIDATRNDPPYNTNSMPSYDESSFYVGSTTPLDKMNEAQENLLYSPDPMDPNWGGAEFTEHLVEAGYYAGNEVKNVFR